MNRWKNWFFAYWFRFKEIKSWSNFFLGRHGINGCGQSGHETLKLTVSQKWTYEINWFFACWYKFRKAESWFKDFWVGIVKNVHGLIFWMLIVMQLFLVRLVSCTMTFNYRGEGVGSTAVARLVWAEIRSPPTPWLLDMGGPLQLYFLFEGRLDLQNLAKCEIFLRLRG